MGDLYSRYLKLRQKERPTFDWRKVAFDKQVSCITDPSRLKCFFTTRRAAKSFTDGIYLLKEAFETERCNCLYLSLTRLSSKGIIWKDVLKEINTKEDLGCKFNETELTCTTPNGSVIYVSGVDVDEHERKKLFGRKYKLIVIDEAALFGIDMYDLVYVVLKPATADLLGTIVLSGMASNITQGLFYDITTGKEKGWSVHKWSAFDNPYVAKQWGIELEDIRRDRPEFMNTPRFKQAYLNEWVVDQDALVYRFSEDLNRAHHLPSVSGHWSYVLGVDLGHSPDPTAFVVGAYSNEHPQLFILHAEKHLELDITDVAQKIQQLEKRFTFEVKVVDNANKQAVAELNNRHKCNLIPADKTGKSDFINLMNDEFIQGRIKVIGCDDLVAEWKALIWEMEDGKVVIPRKEHASLANHLADAGLYLWRYCHQYLWKKPEPVVDYHSQERWEPEHVKRLEEQVERERNPDQWHEMFTPDEGLFNFEHD